MADVLSQSEIDALLNALDSGDTESVLTPKEEEVKVRSYDFRLANRFSKENMRTFNTIYETFAHLFTTYLSGTLRVMCVCEVLSIEEINYREFVNSLPSPVLLGIINMQPLTGPTLLEVSSGVAYAMLSRLLGGVGSESESAPRTFTEIEMVLLERIMRQFIGLLVEAWGRVTKVSTVLERIETNPQFAQIVAPSEPVAIITLTVRIGTSEGLMNFCLPHVAVEPITTQLNTRLWFQTNTSSSRVKASAPMDIRQRIQTTPLSVSATFNDTTATVRDVLNLQVGDVLQLDHMLSEGLTLKVGHLKKFTGEMGVKENRYALKITSVIREEEEAANE